MELPLTDSVYLFASKASYARMWENSPHIPKTWHVFQINTEMTGLSFKQRINNSELQLEYLTRKKEEHVGRNK
jgi:hypothetical protein